MQTIRCSSCGLTQFQRGACGRCGAALVVEPRSPRRRPSPPSRGSPLQAYLSIWARPRETIREIVATDPSRAVVLLAWLGGTVDALNALVFKTEEQVPWQFVVALAIFLGPLAGFAVVYVDGLVLS